MSAEPVSPDATAADRPPWVRPLLVLLAVAAGYGVTLVPWSQPMPPAASRLLAITVAMALLWFTEAMPLAVTSLVPLVAYPLLGVLGSKPTAAAYINTYTFLFFGGLVIAASLERWNLHRRLALLTMQRVGTSPLRLCIGLMLVAAGLSMWISNTATAMLMLPIGLALLATLEEQMSETDRAASGDTLAACLLLSIAYGANCGGMATPVGTPTNITLLNEWSQVDSLAGRPAPSLAKWLLMAGPFVAAMLGVLVVYFAVRLRRVPKTQLGDDFFADRLRSLGPMDGGSWAVLTIFVLTAAAWITREKLALGETTLSPGWRAPLEAALQNRGWTVPDKSINDTVVAIGAVLLLFVIPGRGRTVVPGTTTTTDVKWQSLVDWDVLEKRLPWGVLLLFGAGFAIAAAFKATGLAEWSGQMLAAQLDGTSPTATTAGVVLLVTGLTEFTTNVGTLNTLLPVVSSLAAELGIDPPQLMLPATLAASCAFMLPIATPPNAIVFGSGRLSLPRMAAAGLLLNVAALILLVLMAPTLFAGA